MSYCFAVAVVLFELWLMLSLQRLDSKRYRIRDLFFTKKLGSLLICSIMAASLGFFIGR